jgi:hypothetical protein
MGIIVDILRLAAYFAILAMDISIFLVLVRLLRRWKPVGLLVAFDNAGAPLVNWLVSKTAIAWRRIYVRGSLSTTGQLLLVLSWLTIGRFFVLFFGASWRH